MINYTKYLHEIKTDGVHLTFGVKVDDFENLEELSNLIINVFDLKKRQNSNSNKCFERHEKKRQN